MKKVPVSKTTKYYDLYLDEYGDLAFMCFSCLTIYTEKFNVNNLACTVCGKHYEETNEAKFFRQRLKLKQSIKKEIRF